MLNRKGIQTTGIRFLGPSKKVKKQSPLIPGQPEEQAISGKTWNDAVSLWLVPVRESNKRDFKVQCPVMESNFHQNWFEPRIRNRTAAPFCSRTKSGVETIKFIRQRFSHNRAMPAEPVPWPSLICLCWEVRYRQGVLHRRTITF